MFQIWVQECSELEKLIIVNRDCRYAGCVLRVWKFQVIEPFLDANGQHAADPIRLELWMREFNRLRADKSKPLGSARTSTFSTNLCKIDAYSNLIASSNLNNLHKSSHFGQFFMNSYQSNSVNRLFMPSKIFERPPSATLRKASGLQQNPFCATTSRNQPASFRNSGDSLSPKGFTRLYEKQVSNGDSRYQIETKHASPRNISKRF